MLKNNEPYRYAIPRTAETKLSKLRVKATGQKRKGGLAKGEKRQAKLPGGSRTIKALDEVCRSEGLPSPRELSRGERRVVHETGSAAFVKQIASAQIVPRRGAAGKAKVVETVARSVSEGKQKPDNENLLIKGSNAKGKR